MTTFYLQRDVHFCYRGDAAVFLDLRNDAYLLFSDTAVSALRAAASPRAVPALQPKLSDAMLELLNNGLVTTDPLSGREMAPTGVALAEDSLVDVDTIFDSHPTAGHILRFLAACAAAAVELRCLHVARVVHRIARRKSAMAGGPLDVASARELTAVFLKLRSFFPRDYLCLYDSLALIEFLAAYRIFPDWIFGIKLEPWAAHCWVQDRTLVFNEDVEQAASYTPIMAV